MTKLLTQDIHARSVAREDCAGISLNRRTLIRFGVGGASAFGFALALGSTGDAAELRIRDRQAALHVGSPTPGGTLVVGLQSEPDTLDPHVTPFAVSHNVMMNIFDTLVWQDPLDGTFKPGLAASWETAQDGLSYTFKLRADVMFHDGSPLTADAVKFSFDRIADPKTKSGFAASLLGPYAGAEVIDASTVQVKFTEPYAPLLDAASQAFLGIVSPAAVAQYGSDNFGQHPVGTGPFVFQEWISQDHVRLTRNADYKWAGGVFSHEGSAYLDEIVFKFIPEDSTRTGTLESGETNLIELVAEGDISLLESEGFTFVKGKAPGVPSVAMLNTAKAPTDDVAVRKAMNLGTDRQSIIDTVYFSVYEPASGPLSKVSWAYDADFEGLYQYDPEQAKQVLDDAGWIATNGGIREKDGHALQVLFVISNWQTYSELWQSQMKAIGIDVKIQQIDPSVEIDVLSKGESNVSALEWISSDPIILEQIFHSKNIDVGFAWSRFRDSALDGLLEKGRRALNVDERKRLYFDAQQIVMEQALIVPFFDQTAYNGLSEHVHGVRVDARGWYRWLYDAWLG